jgi:hypothetical protein
MKTGHIKNQLADILTKILGWVKFELRTQIDLVHNMTAHTRLRSI